MNFLFVCLSSAVAALAIHSEALPAGADVPVLFDRNVNLNVETESQGDPRRLSESEPETCNKQSTGGTPTKTVRFGVTTLQASFTCGGDYTNGLIPDDQTHSTQCLQGPTDNAAADIATVLKVQGRVSSVGQKFIVTLAKFPDDRGQKIYYKCKKADQDVCLVALALPPATGPNECAIDKVLTFSLGTSVPSVNFKCAGGSVNPKPFGVSNGACTATPKETNAVKLTQVTTGTKAYQLTADQLPSQAEQICYTCTYSKVPTPEGQQKDRTCSVIVTVEAPASSTSTVTTTSSARSILTTCGAMNILIAVFVTAGAFS